ncbi:unnamed protein product [Penicillium discolor]
MTEPQKRISSIRADRVLGEFGYEVEFPGSSDNNRMRLIYAPNGRGKTNFLRAIHAALTASPEALQALIEIPLARLEITFADGGSILVERAQHLVGSYSATATLHPNEQGISINVDPADFAGRLYRLFIGDDRLAPPTDDVREGTRPDGGSLAGNRRRHGSLTRLLDTVERMLTQSALASLSRESAQTGIYNQITRTTLQGSSELTASEARAALEAQITGLLEQGTPLEQYQLLSMRQLRDIATQLGGVRANNRQLPIVHLILKPYLDSLADQINSLAPAYQLIDTYVKGVNRFLDRKELQFTAPRGIRLVGRDGKSLHPEGLSSGERHLLLLLSQAVLATSDSPLVIVDEPELSLGLEWQRDLLSELLRCSQSGNVQFLIASHSVQIMGAVPREDIVQPSEAP